MARAIIPFSFYCLSETLGNNLLSYAETTSASSNSNTITIPSANYTILTSLAKIKSMLESSSASAGRNFIYNLSYDEDQSKCSFLISSGLNAIAATDRSEDCQLCHRWGARTWPLTHCDLYDQFAQNTYMLEIFLWLIMEKVALAIKAT